MADTTPTENIVQGTAKADTLNGGSGADVIFGFEGGDTLNGKAGNDIIVGDGWTMSAAPKRTRPQRCPSSRRTPRAPSTPRASASSCKAATGSTWSA